MLSRQTIALVAIFVVLCGVVYVTELRSKPSDASAGGATSADKVFGTLQITDVKALTVSQGGTTVTVDRQNDGSWKLAQPEAQYTDTTRVSSIASELLAATKQRDLPLANVDLKQYGLDSPWLTATLDETKGQETLQVGNQNVDGSSRYAMLKGAQSAFLLSVGTADSLASLVKQPPIATPTVPATPVPTLAPLPSPSPSATP